MDLMDRGLSQKSLIFRDGTDPDLEPSFFIAKFLKMYPLQEGYGPGSGKLGTALSLLCLVFFSLQEKSLKMA